MGEEAKQPDPATQRLITLVALACVVPVLYWAWSYSGPYRWLAELQLRWFGAYEKTLTFVLTLFALVLPVLGVGALVRKMGFARKTEAQPEAGGTWQSLSKYIADFVVMGVGLFLLGMGAVQYYRGTREAQVTAIEAREIEAGKKLERLWVEVAGKTLFDDAAVISSKNKDTFYVPVVSANWQAGQPVAVYLEVHERDLNEELKRKEGRYQGMVTISGLPGMAREDLKRRGLGPAEKYVMVDYQRTPAIERKIGRDMSLLGGGIALFGLGLVAYQKFRMGRLGPAQSEPVVAKLQIKAIVPLDNRRADQSR